jgi:hypothetical protein
VTEWFPRCRYTGACDGRGWGGAPVAHRHAPEAIAPDEFVEPRTVQFWHGFFCRRWRFELVRQFLDSQEYRATRQGSGLVFRSRARRIWIARRSEVRR